tara:strand:+ start:2183 stop:2764 length:582 start_codon:yes stop_codon:yes gene_type:complete
MLNEEKSKEVEMESDSNDEESIEELESVNYDTDNEDIDNIELNMNWIKNFENENDIYNKFELKEQYKIKVHVIYVSASNETTNDTRSELKLKNKNIITKEELLYQIKNHMTQKYTLLSILTYNIDILNVNDLNKDFLENHKHIDDIKLDSSLFCFHNLNTLYLVFKEKEIKENIYTKKIHYKPSIKRTKHKRK